MTVLTFFPRMGGKRLLVKRLLKMFPKDWGVYVEPFFGAGNLFFALEKPDCKRCEVVNDLDKNVYHALKDVQRVSVEDVEKMDFTPSKARFEELRDSKPEGYAERLHRFLYVYWWSFGGMGKHFARERARSGLVRKKTFLKKLGLIQERLKDVVVENRDYKTVLRDYDSKDTFFFIDPPYYGLSDDGYDVPGKINIEELGLALKNLKGKFMLTYNDHPKVREVFKGFHVKTVKTLYTVSGKNQEVVELVFRNYTS